MRIIISPAKKMNVDTDSLEWHDLPVFLPQTQLLAERLQQMSDADTYVFLEASGKGKSA